MRKYILVLIFLLCGMLFSHAQYYYNIDVNWGIVGTPRQSNMLIEVQKENGTFETIINSNTPPLQQRLGINLDSPIIEVTGRLAYFDGFNASCSSAQTYDYLNN